MTVEPTRVTTMKYRKNTIEDDEKEIRVISSQTPNKNVDPKTGEGRKKIQKKT